MIIGKRLLALVLAVTLIVSCGISTVLANGRAAADNDSGIRISDFTYDNTQIAVGDNAKIAAMVTQYKNSEVGALWNAVNATVTYTIDNTNVARIHSSGQVTGLAAGTVTVTATATYTLNGTYPLNGGAWDTTWTATSDVTIEVTAKPGTIVNKMLLAEELDRGVDDVLGKIALSNDGDDVFSSEDWTTPKMYTAYEVAHKAAVVVFNNKAATQAQVDAAVATLSTAYTNMKLAQGARKKATSAPDVKYPNNLSYVSIDTKDASKLSDYVSVANYGKNIVGVRVMYELGNSDSAELYSALTTSFGGTGDHQFGHDKYFRLALNSGTTLKKSMYLVPIMVQYDNGEGAMVKVELHVNGTDPAYLKTSEAVFAVGDLNNPGKEIISSTIVIKSPSGETIRSVLLAKKGTPYTVTGGKWDAATKEYSFQLKATADETNGVITLRDAEILVSFAGKGRMAFHPATIAVELVTDDKKLKEYFDIRPYALTIDENSDDSYMTYPIEVYPTKKADDANLYGYGEVLEITNFTASPANAIMLVTNTWGYHVVANAKGTATFDAVVDLVMSGVNPFKVKARTTRWLAGDAKLSSPIIPSSQQGSIAIYSHSKIDINMLETYAVEMRAVATDENGKTIEITNLALAEMGDDNQLFKITTPEKQINGEYKFTAILQNVDATLTNDTFNLLFTATTGETKHTAGAQIRMLAEYDEPKAIYLTKGGKKIEADTLAVGADSAKYGLVVDGYKMAQGDAISLTGNDSYTIVRGETFYFDMGTKEDITIRLDTTIPDDELAALVPQLTYNAQPKVTNKAVKLKFAQGIAIQRIFNGTPLFFTSKIVAIDKTALKTAIAAATAAKKNIFVSANGSNISKTQKWVTQAVMTAFNKSISDAQAVVDDAKASEAEIAMAITMIQADTAAFVKAQKFGTKSGSSGSGSTGNNTSAGTPAPTEPTSKEVNTDGSVKGEETAKEVADAIKNALAANAGAVNPTVGVVIENAKTITPAALKEIADAAKAAGGNVKLNFDTTKDGKTVGRITVDPAQAAALGKSINLSIATDEATTKPIVDKMNEYFTNEVVVASFGQAGELGMTVDVAVRVDLSKIDLSKLVIYSYDRLTNTFIKIDAGKLMVDKNGFLHFKTNRGGDLVLSNGPLASK